MKKISFVSLFIIFFSTIPFCFSQIGGKGVYEFLNLAIPARVSALGGTLISAKDNDLNLSFQNPALLDSTMHNSLSLSYINYLADIRYSYASYSRTYRNVGSFSAGIQSLNYGSFIGADKNGELTGNFTAADYSLNLAYSRPIGTMFSIGGTLKTIYSKYSEYTSVGSALDLGGVYNDQKHLFTSALIIKNIGKQWKTYYGLHEPLPFEIQFGLTKKITHAPFRISLTATHLERWDLTYVDPSIPTTDPITGVPITKSAISTFSDKLARHAVVGGEILLSKNFNLRLGYNYQRRQELKLESHPGIAGFSFGFGLKIYKFHLSYSYAKFHAAGGPNNFTISTNFSEYYSKK